MKKFEFKVVSAPDKAKKFVNLGPGEDAFNLTVAATMNALGSEGWEFVGAEVLPEPKRFLGGRRARRNVLVFRREVLSLEQVETEKAELANVMILKNAEQVRPRRIRKIKSPPFVRRITPENNIEPDKLKA